MMNSEVGFSKEGVDCLDVGHDSLPDSIFVIDISIDIIIDKEVEWHGFHGAF